ncbi:MAG: hypothetical protein JWO13_521 [Acidobacteriales bacterium]|nr:hypothetical protein [Terriglobales bacterium]
MEHYLPDLEPLPMIPAICAASLLQWTTCSFDGLTLDRLIKRITFIEAECGRSRLTPMQRILREAIEKKGITSKVWEIGHPNIPITLQLARGSRRVLAE